MAKTDRLTRTDTTSCGVHGAPAAGGPGGRIVIVGAGWAGLAAAWEISRRSAGGEGHGRPEIWLVERAPRPGGRAFSFRDRATGLELDNGQHVLLGCCDQFVHFLQEIGLGAAVRFQDLLDIPVFAGGRWERLASARLPGPLHLLRLLTQYRHLSLADRWRLLRVVRPLQRPDHRQRDNMSFADWLALQGQSARAVERLWDLVGVAVLNGRADQVSAGLALESFRIGVISGWRAARLGYLTIPLGYAARAAAEALQARGVHVLFHQAVDEVLVESGRVKGVRIRRGPTLEADAVVAAVPHDALYKLLPPAWRLHEAFAQSARLAWSPILNVYLLYDQPVFHEEVAAFCGGVVQFVFNRGRLLGEPDLDGRWLSVSLSAAGGLRNWPAAKVIDRVDEELRRTFPRPASGARCLHAATVWQPRATFLAAPGTWRLRPPPKSPVSGLFLAGDWTDTGWPACLEGAVRSGRRAAEALDQWFRERQGGGERFWASRS
ncbi:MAG: FAD-dependent oxidoreductase [Alicyclobacillaceae bacterium]|nr:FAD-dependent oxidoreductase [Alicyclobacillaceae bacterium]